MASRQKNTYLSAQYHRIAARSGKNKVAIAVGHTILSLVHILLTRKQEYVDLGFNYFDERKKDILIRNSIKRLESLGLVVRVQEQTAYNYRYIERIALVTLFLKSKSFNAYFF